MNPGIVLWKCNTICVGPRRYRNTKTKAQMNTCINAIGIALRGYRFENAVNCLSRKIAKRMPPPARLTDAKDIDKISLVLSICPSNGLTGILYFTTGKEKCQGKAGMCSAVCLLDAEWKCVSRVYHSKGNVK
jgi:hypothetical protein